MGSGVSVVVTGRNGGAALAPCLTSIAAQGPVVRQVVVACGGLLGGDLQLAKRHGWAVVALNGAPGFAAAANAGVRATTEELVAFVDAACEARSGWAHALSEAADGAALVAGRIEPHAPGCGRCAGWRSGHDPRGRNGFLPSATVANLAVRRSVFEALGGFDQALGPVADVDLCFRAQLEGHPFVEAPHALVVETSGSTIAQRVRGEIRVGRGMELLRLRYRQFAFQDGPASTDRLRVPGRIRAAELTAAAAVARSTAERGRIAAPARPAVCAAARTLGTAWQRADLLTRPTLRPIPVVPSSAADEAAATRLSAGPALVVAGPRAFAAEALARAAGEVLGLAAPPPGLAEAAVRCWDDPAPWSLRLARLAGKAGWRIPVLLAARRLEAEQPRTWGEAVLALHAIEAWLTRRQGYVLTVLGAAARDVAERLRRVPLVSVGPLLEGRPGTLVVGAADVFLRPQLLQKVAALVTLADG